METVIIPARIIIRQLTTEDIDRVCELMSKDKEVAFCQWENHDLFEREIQDPDSVLLVAEIDNRIVGALIGGHYGNSGMICHVDVERELRSHGIGRTLSLHALEVFRSRGIESVQLIVTAENVRGLHFWQGLGFEVDQNRVLLEMDIEELVDCPASVEVVSFADQVYFSDFGPTISQDVLLRSSQQRHGLILRRPTEAQAAMMHGGLHGFRAWVDTLSGDSSFWHDLLKAALHHFASYGTRRVQTAVSLDEEERRVQLERFGFHENPGEQLLRIRL